MITLPGLIDPHVHLRSMGQEEKEDFFSGTRAALAGGFTTILDMPNNQIPITTKNALMQKIERAREEIVCNVGFYFGSVGDNLNEFETVSDQTFGLKLYLNKTTGNFLLDKTKLSEVFRSWTSQKPILLHAIDETIDEVIHVLKDHPRQIHICHISSEYEFSRVIEAKEQNLPITCGVTPHHLFLTEDDEKYLGSYGKMQPPLRKQSDVEFLWKNIHAIDCIESDHAPHSREEKESTPTPYGIPGLETTLPLLLNALYENRLKLEDIIRLCHDGPKQIFLKHTNNYKEDYTLEIDEHSEWEIDSSQFFSKAKWSPFDSWKIKGKLTTVKRSDKVLFRNGEIYAQKASGNILLP